MRKLLYYIPISLLMSIYFSITPSGLTEGLKNVTSRTKPTPNTTSTLTEVTEEESDHLLAQRESSHEYD